MKFNWNHATKEYEKTFHSWIYHAVRVSWITLAAYLILTEYEIL